MAPGKTNGNPEDPAEKHEADSLADQALEAIVRSQQLRARARKLRQKDGVTSTDGEETRS